MSDARREALASDLMEIVSEEKSVEVKNLATMLEILILEKDKSVGKYLMLATKAKEMMIRKSVAIESGTDSETVVDDVKSAVALKFIAMVATEIGRAINMGIDEIQWVSMQASKFAVQLSDLSDAVKHLNQKAVL